ncbi:MAG: dihydrodipicolinate synthase family protein [Acidobacteria bacterium]|nr:dihydrodipicolinate synthase family protein [Acidobacteriota bacterium]
MHQKQLFGIIPPLVTPFRQDGTIDYESLRAEVEHMIRVGAAGVAVCGSTGEGHTLSTEETRAIVGCAMEAAAGRIPVIAGIITNSTASAVERGRAVAGLGVAALQVTPPHYVFRPDDEAMVRHFAEIAGGTGVGVVIYNVVPWSYLLPPLLTRILRESDGVIGVKQSASDMKALADLLLLLEEAGILGKKRVLSAVDALLYPSFSIGAHGAIAAILTAVPEWCVELWNAVGSGDLATAMVLHKRLLRLWNAIDAPNLPANTRTVMAMRGRQGGVPRPPMPVSSPAQVEKIRLALAE